MIYSGAGKTYANATNVAAGSLYIADGTSLSSAGNVTVENGAKLVVDGSLRA